MAEVVWKFSLELFSFKISPVWFSVGCRPPGNLAGRQVPETKRNSQTTISVQNRKSINDLNNMSRIDRQREINSKIRNAAIKILVSYDAVSYKKLRVDKGVIL